MGASFSTRLSESNMELRKRIDAAATEVVLDASFTDLTKLANEKNCNRLVKKVSGIFQKNKDVIDLELLRQKLYDQKRKDGENADNDAATGSTADSDTDNSGREKHVKKIKTPRIQNIEKKCIQISKFYVLFGHLFSCIVSTINPSFKVESEKDKDKDKDKDKKSTSESKEAKESSVQQMDFCTLRIDALVNNSSEQDSDGNIRVNPDVCKTNVSKSGKALHFIDLPGMKALQELYKGANDGGESEKDDARYFFEAFTGKKPSDDIRRLDQIPLKTYNGDKECEEQKNYRGGDETSEEALRKERRSLEKEREREQEERERMFYAFTQRDRDRKRNEEDDARAGVYLKGVVGSLKERLFSEYVQHIKEMIERAEYNRSKLLEILSEMFTYQYDENGNINGVIINPSLTYKKLQALVVQTRRIVIKLYTDCEEDYKNGLDIFFAIVQEKIALKLSVQEEVLKKQLEDVMYGPQERYIPESLLYQQQFPGAAEQFNKKQFVPPHFKSSVVSIVQKELRNSTAFQSISPSLNEWINEEIENATSLLDPKQVADEFLKENVYGDYDESSSAAAPIMNDDSSSSYSALVAPSAVTATPAPAPAIPLPKTAVASTPMSKTSSSSKITATSTSLPGPSSIPPSPRRVKRSEFDIKPTKLSTLFDDD